MPQSVNLKQIERHAWMSLFEDGLLDIYLGLMLLILGMGDLFPRVFTSELRLYGAYVVLAALAFLPYWAGKRFITIPRMGRAKFGPARKARQTKAAVVYGISVIAGVIVLLLAMLGLSSSPTAWVQRLGARGFIALGAGGWMMLIFVLGSYFTEFPRGYVITVFYGLGFAGTVMLGKPLVLFLAGSVIVLMGLIVFVRFLRKYRVPSAGPPLEGALDDNH